MGFISCHITPLVILIALGTDTHTNMVIDNLHRIHFKKPGILVTGWCAPGLKAEAHVNGAC